ncbi:FCD domain-containing protein [Pseudarthrobacter sp. NBSH8]|nr:FCD domain-containing protein [Pseudarthrobacter sp. NBSH8]
MGRITGLIPDADLPQLRVLAQAIVDAAQSKDVVAFVEADTDFHLSLLAYSGNQRLLGVIRHRPGQAARRLQGAEKDPHAGTGGRAGSARRQRCSESCSCP